MEAVMFMLLWHVLSGRRRLAVEQKNVRSRLGRSDLGKCSVVWVQGLRADVPESACSLYYNEQTPIIFLHWKFKKCIRVFRFGAYSLCTLFPIKKNMRQFRLSGENVVIHSHSIFFSPIERFALRRKNKLSFMVIFYWQKYWEGYLNFCSSRNYSFVLVWDGDGLAQGRFLIQGRSSDWLVEITCCLLPASLPGLDWSLCSAVWCLCSLRWLLQWLKVAEE